MKVYSCHIPVLHWYLAVVVLTTYHNHNFSQLIPPFLPPCTGFVHRLIALLWIIVTNVTVRVDRGNPTSLQARVLCPVHFHRPK